MSMQFSFIIICIYQLLRTIMKQKPKRKLNDFSISLKRTITERNSIKKDPFQAYTTLGVSRLKDLSLSSFSQSPQREKTTNIFIEESPISKLSTQAQSHEEFFSEKDEGWRKVQTKISEIIEEDIKQSVKTKDKQSLHHRYVETEDNSTIWISQPKWIPSQVLATYQEAKQNNDDSSRINFTQGFLSDIGFMYYAVQRQLFFYDIESMNQYSTCDVIFEIQEKVVNSFYGIQMLTLGQPYLSVERKVLAFFHFNQVEFYRFELNRNINKKQRTLSVYSLNLHFHLETLKPKQIIKDRRGILFYADNKGNLKEIEYDHSVLKKAASQITTQVHRVTQDFKEFFKHMSTNIAKSLLFCGKTAINFGKSFFLKDAEKSILSYDQERNLMFVFHCSRLKQGKYKQEMRVYNPEDLRMLYTVKEIQKLNRHSPENVVVNMTILESKLNNDYNLVALMNNGKRMFMDLRLDDCRKIVTYQHPPTNNIKYFGQNTHYSVRVQSHIIQQTFCVALTYTNTSFTCNFMRQDWSSLDQAVSRLDVQLHGGPRENQYFLFARQLQELGPTKNCLLKTEGNNIKCKDMVTEVQSVFYRPQQFVHTSDKMAQRIILLRPVDILFTLVNEFDSIPQIEKCLKNILDMKNEELIGLCCQILFDEQGIYFSSQQLVISAKLHANVRIQESERRRETEQIEEFQYKSIPKQVSRKLDDLIVDLSSPEIGASKEQRQNIVASGFLLYFSKIFRTVWFTDINQLNKQVCKELIQILREFSALVSRSQQRIRCNTDGFLKSIIVWCQKIKELTIMIMTLPSLPKLQFHESISLEPEDFYESLFYYLLKYCEKGMIKQLQKVVPHYADEEFRKGFRLWESLQEFKTKEEKIYLCQQQSHIPDFVIKELEKNKNLRDIKYICETKNMSNQENQRSYSQILNYIRQFSSSIVEKQILLDLAEKKIKDKEKQNEEKYNEVMEQIAERKALLHLQKLLKQHYLQNTKVQKKWTERLSSRFSFQKDKEIHSFHIEDYLESFNFDFETISSLIDSTNNPLLDIALANYSTVNELTNKVNKMLSKTISQNKDFDELVNQLKYQFQYLITKVKIYLDKYVLLKLYLNSLAQIPEIIDRMNSEEGILQQSTFFLLTLTVELLGQPQGVYRWSNHFLNQLLPTDIEFLYLNACITYLIRQYLPKKKEEFIEKLSKHTTNEVIFKKLIALLME